MNKPSKEAIAGAIDALTSPNSSNKCPWNTSFGCVRYEDPCDCSIGTGDAYHIAECWKMAFEKKTKPKKRKMGKVTKALMKYATDGGCKTASFCPSEAGFHCPEFCIDGEGCTVGDKPKKIRKCWKTVYREQENEN